MGQEREPGKAVHIWIDEASRTISFKKADGFEPLGFPNHEAMMAYVVEKGALGYRIQ